VNQAEFEVVVQETMHNIHNLLKVKGGEYAGSTDRLANFKRGSQLTGATPLQVLFVYLSKHYDAVATFVRDEAFRVTRERSEPIDGRLDDIINYCLLAKALIRESEQTDVAARDPRFDNDWIRRGPDSATLVGDALQQAIHDRRESGMDGALHRR
jgi:hypothetical protein